MTTILGSHLILHNWPLINDHLSKQRPQFFGPEDGRYAQVWLKWKLTLTFFSIQFLNPFFMFGNQITDFLDATCSVSKSQHCDGIAVVAEAAGVSKGQWTKCPHLPPPLVGEVPDFANDPLAICQCPMGLEEAAISQQQREVVLPVRPRRSEDEVLACCPRRSWWKWSCPSPRRELVRLRISIGLDGNSINTF